MKLLKTIVLILIANIAFSQISILEQRLNREEQKLVELEQDYQTIKANLIASGQSTSASYKLSSLKDQIKTQKGTVKAIRKEFKAYQKSLKEPTNTTTQVSSEVSNKAKIKELKKEIKSLTKQRKSAEKLATSVGVDPTKDATVQAVQKKINQLQEQLNQLQPNQVISPTVPTSEIVYNVTNSRDELKLLKKEIKGLKKQKKFLLKEAKAMKINSADDDRIIDIDDKLYAKQVEYAKLKQLPMPVRSSLPNYIPNAVVENSSTVNTQASLPQVVDHSAQIKMTRKELKKLQRQQRKAVKTAIANQQNPAQDKTVITLGKQIKNKQELLYQLEQGVTTTTNNNTEPQASQVEVVKTDHPTIGLSTILFEKYSAEVNEEYRNYISHVAKQLKDNPTLALRINAFTDNSEKERISYDLTQKMMLNVAQEFLNRGIDKSRLIVQAKGSKNPKGDNKTFYGQARNRRVELSFTTMPEVTQ